MPKRDSEATVQPSSIADKTCPVCSALQRLVEWFPDPLLFSDLKSYLFPSNLQQISFWQKHSLAKQKSIQISQQEAMV